MMITNVFICIIIFAAAAAITYFSLKNKPTLNQMLMVREWLKWAVMEAEKQFGSKVGQVKLHYVYDLAVKKFPVIMEHIQFSQFSEWVDDALYWMKRQLDSNEAIENYINS